MKGKMIEQAEEELQRLESEHPDNFHVLKMELKSLISLFHHSISLSQPHLTPFHHDAGDTPSSASTATTQESTCRKRKRVGLRKQTPSSASAIKLVGDQRHKPSCCYKEEWESSNKSLLDNDRVEAVLHRAQLCLQKLHAFKTTL